MYSKEQEETENEINIDSTNSTGATEDKLNLYPTAQQIINSLESNEEFNDNIMEQLSLYYKNLIPGESDEVFLPPTSVSTKKIHTGPRVLHDAYDTSKTDSSTSSYPLTNGQNSSLENSDLSISDHIVEVS